MSAQIASAIIKAIAKGFTAKTILQHLSRNYPQHAGKISNALAMGYTAETILKKLADKSGKNPDNVDDYLTDSEKTDRNDTERKRKAAIGLGVGAASLAALGTGVGLAGRAAQALPAAAQITNNPPMGPGPNSPGVQVLNPMPPTNPVQPGPGIGQQMQQQVQPNINQPMPIQPAQAQPIQQPITPPQPTLPASQVFQGLGALKQVNNMLDAGNPPEVIADVVNSMLKGDVRKSFGQMLKTGQVKPLIDMIKDIQQERELSKTNEPAQMPIVPQQEQPPIEQQKINEEQQPERPIEKKSLVATPNGMGEVKSISGDKAMVEVDGKATPIPLDDLTQSPLPEKDLAQLYDDLIEGVERETGQDVSRMVEIAAYNPIDNELLFVPYTGAIYHYKNISPEQREKLTNILATRKTSGENFIGSWDAGSKSPIGAEMSALIRELQKEAGGKGKEYSGKYETIYKGIEPAILASKEAKKQRDKNAKLAAKGKPVEEVKKKPIPKREYAEKTGQPINEGALKKEDKFIKNMGEDEKFIYSGDVPTDEIVARPKLMQFKDISEGKSETGENEADTLKGKFDALKSGVLLLWEPKDPKQYDMTGNQKYIVSNGHHRLAFAKRQGVPNLLTRFIRQEDGYTARDAMRIGAEINIAEGKGTIHDQAKYFRELIESSGKDKAAIAGERTGKQGQDAWTIAANAGNELFSAFVGENIKPGQAIAIAEATTDKNRQLLGLKLARDGRSAESIKNFIEASKHVKKKADFQMDLFGNDDSAFKAMDEMAKSATELQKDLKQDLAAISGASKRPANAKKYGIDINDPESVKEAREKLSKELERWKNWSVHSDLVEKVKDRVNKNGK